MVKKKNLEEKVILYRNVKSNTSIIEFHNFSDMFKHYNILDDDNSFTNVRSCSEPNGFNIKSQESFGDWKPVSSQYNKSITYQTYINEVFKRGDKIVVKLYYIRKEKGVEYKYFKKYLEVTYIVFNLKTNNYYHIYKNWYSRKWRSSKIRVNNVLFNFVLNDYKLLETLCYVLNYSKIIPVSKGNLLKNLRELCVDWYIKRNNIKYDLNGTYYLKYQKPPKNYVNGKSFLEGVINYYKPSQNLLKYIKSNHNVNIKLFSQLEKYIPFNVLETYIFSINLTMVRLKRKYKIGYDTLIEDEWHRVFDKIKYLNNNYINFLFEKIEQKYLKNL